jgi:putative hydrolase of the HAD superfamily
MKHLPPVILLDLDDTILNFTAVGNECLEELCAAYAPRAGVSREALWGTVQNVRDWYWSDPDRHRRGRMDLQAARRELIGLVFERLRINDQTLANELADTFTVRREELVRPFPGAIEALNIFRKSGARLGLLTNGASRFQRAKIDRFGLARFFDLILIEGEFGVGKPDERVFRHALEFFSAAPHEACMIGDNPEWDIRPALELGMAAIWVDSGTASLPADGSIRPTLIIKSLADLMDRELNR